MCFVDLDIVLYALLRKVLEMAMMHDGIPDVLVRLVMSLYEGAKTTVRVDSSSSRKVQLQKSEELSVEFGVKVGMR